jgi:hypothetical protein
MPSVFWSPNADGRYVIDVVLGGLLFRAMIDTGVVSRAGTIGFDLDQTDFDVLWNARRLIAPQRHRRTDVTGRQTIILSAETNAQMFDSAVRQPIGPIMRIRVCRGNPGVISRVGVGFFHRLSGCFVHWDLDRQIWLVEYT